jgi:predicted alpha/beta hydrolase family esterase
MTVPAGSSEALSGSMRAILVHGMGRTLASQLVLAARLRRAGMRVDLFGYSSTSAFDHVVGRLAARVESAASGEPFILIGHSLGCVMIRAALPRLARPPVACFFMAPPNRAARAARHFASNALYRLLTRESGQRLADERFMASLPVPQVPVRIYAGVSGPRGRLSPFRGEENDGILAVSETEMPAPNAVVVRVPSVHTFIMNSAIVAKDIVATSRSLRP